MIVIINVSHTNPLSNLAYIYQIEGHIQLNSSTFKALSTYESII